MILVTISHQFNTGLHRGNISYSDQSVNISYSETKIVECCEHCVMCESVIKVHLQSMTGRGETNVDQHNCDESRPGQILMF